jgi:perosamine synthetase
MTNMQTQIFKPYVSEKAIERVLQVLRSGWIGEGSLVKEFEEKLGKIVGCQYPVAVNSGTSALHLALLVAGIKAGDEVITTAQTMLATTQAILAVGATPVYADVQYMNGNLDPQEVAKRITPHTRAIVAVDWAGYPCDYDELLDIAQANDLVMIEDAAHALGGSYHGKPVGSICPYTCFSFQAIKHLTTGDGGMLCVSNEQDYFTAIRLRWYGIDRFKRQPSVLGEPIWNVTELGYKYHMNDIAAAIGLGNLEDWEFIKQRRHQIVACYREALADVPNLMLFERKDERQSADWLFSVHVERRQKFCETMTAKGVAASVIHLRIDRNDLCGGERSDLPELAHFTETHVSLPLHPHLTDEEVEYIISCVRAGW